VQIPAKQPTLINAGDTYGGIYTRIYREITTNTASSVRFSVGCARQLRLLPAMQTPVVKLKMPSHEYMYEGKSNKIMSHNQ